MTIHLAKKAYMVLLLAKKITILAKYLDFANKFSEKSANILLEQTKVNDYIIKLEEGKEPPYGPIYSLELVELKTLKIYIMTNLANGFIRTSKSPAGALILFVHKPYGIFCLSVNYQGLNNLLIKNWYLLLLIGKTLNRLSQHKQFT